jgi:hypothetical protein
VKAVAVSGAGRDASVGGEMRRCRCGARTWCSACARAEQARPGVSGSQVVRARHPGRRQRGCGEACGFAGREPVQVAVTPSFNGKTEYIGHVCARIKLHTRNDIVNTKISATRIKNYYMTKVLNET